MTKVKKKFDLDLELETRKTEHFKDMIRLRDQGSIFDNERSYNILTVVIFKLRELQKVLNYDTEYFERFIFNDEDIVECNIEAEIEFKHNLNQHVYNIMIKDLNVKLNQDEDSRIRQYIELILKRNKNMYKISETIGLYMREEEPIIKKYYNIDKLYDEQMKKMIKEFNKKNQRTQVTNHPYSHRLEFASHTD